MKYQYDYIVRNKNNDAYIFRLKALKDHHTKTFPDKDYDNTKKSAEAYGRKILNSLSKKDKKTLRTGYPKFQNNAGVLLCTRIIEGVSIPTYYMAKAYDKFTKKMNCKSFSFRTIRSQDEAKKLAEQWRKKTVKAINLKATQRGYNE